MRSSVLIGGALAAALVVAAAKAAEDEAPKGARFSDQAAAALNKTPGAFISPDADPILASRTGAETRR